MEWNALMTFTRDIQAAGCALLIAACSRTEARGAEPAKPSVAEPAPVPVASPPPQPQPQAEPTPIPTAQPSAQPSAQAAAPGAPIPEEERALFNIIERLVREPGSLSELAPKATRPSSLATPRTVVGRRTSPSRARATRSC